VGAEVMTTIMIVTWSRQLTALAILLKYCRQGNWCSCPWSFAVFESLAAFWSPAV